jgi:hypothetical protein
VDLSLSIIMGIKGGNSITRTKLPGGSSDTKKIVILPRPETKVDVGIEVSSYLYAALAGRMGGPR